METEVMLPSPPPEFNFDSACTSPFMTAPSSPSFFPRASYWDPQFQNLQNASCFNNSYDFEFDFSGFSQKRLSVSDADDLFFKGQIKPLRPSPRVQLVTVGSPRSTKSITKENKDFEPFEEAIKPCESEKRVTKHGKSRPGSPLRVSDILAEDEPELIKTKTEKNTMFSFSKSVWKRYKKWKIINFLASRNASESKNDSKKDYKSFEEGVKSSSFRSTESFGSGSGSGPRRNGSLSAHEVHYTINRAVQEEMKKKTSLPYKHGLMGMGCLGLEQPVHDLVRNFGSTRG